MSQLTIYFSNSLRENLDTEELEKRVLHTLHQYHSTKAEVKISDVVAVKPEVSLIFSDFSSADYELLQEIIDEVVDTLAFYFGAALKDKTISTLMRCTINDTFEVEPY